MYSLSLKRFPVLWYRCKDVLGVMGLFAALGTVAPGALIMVTALEMIGFRVYRFLGIVLRALDQTTMSATVETP